MITRKPVVCESPGKGLVMQGEDASPRVPFFFFGKLTYVLKEEDTNNIRGIPQIYNDNRNIKQQMATG